MDKSSWDRVKWRLIKNHLGYTPEELELFKANPRNEAVLDMGRGLQGKRIVIGVVGSLGCNSRHQVGDKFIFDGAGNLRTRHYPDKICVFALNAATGRRTIGGKRLLGRWDSHDKAAGQRTCPGESGEERSPTTPSSCPQLSARESVPGGPGAPTLRPPLLIQRA